ncbi:MAG TPA: two-component regulator propeller domain-containing protein, partial [Polyangiaceae bacterium]
MRAAILLTLALALLQREAAADEPLHTVVRDDDGAIEPAGVLDAMRPALRVFRDRDGLPQNSAMALAFGDDGALWVGTQDGIASFDGRVWTTAALPHPEVSGFVRDLLVDHTGALWVARQDGGLARLAGGAWTTYGAAEGLPSGRVDSLAEASGPDGSRTLWAGTHQGLARFDGATWHAFAGNAALPSPGISRLLAGTDDGGAPVLWVGTEQGLAQVRGETATLVPGAPHTLVHALLETVDPDGSHTLWVGASREPLYRLTRGVWRATGAPAIPHADVWALGETIAADGQHVVWVATDDGVTRLDHGRWIPMPD